MAAVPEYWTYLSFKSTLDGTGAASLLGAPGKSRGPHPQTQYYAELVKILKVATDDDDKERRAAAFQTMKMFTWDGLFILDNESLCIDFATQRPGVPPLNSIVQGAHDYVHSLSEQVQALYTDRACQNRNAYWEKVAEAVKTGGPFPTNMYHTPVEHESKELRAIERAVRSAKTTEDCDVCLQKADARMAALHARLQDLGIEH